MTLSSCNSRRQFEGTQAHHGAYEITSPVENGDVSAAAGFETLAAYSGLQNRAEAAKHGLLTFLDAKSQGRRVLGYGAAAKGNTLLNYAGIKGLIACGC